MTKTRATAARIVQRVLQKQCTLETAIESENLAVFDDKDKRFIINLCFGTIRWYFQLVEITKNLLHKPLPVKHQDVLCVLLIGLYQLIYLETPHYAAISETVNTAKALKKNWATGLINKVLRLFCEKKAFLIKEIDPYAHPAWLKEKIKSDWPAQWQEILEANNQQAPTTLRINPQFTSGQAYLDLLKAQNIHAHRIETLPFAIQLDKPARVQELPNFNEGWCYIQDEAGQYIPSLLELKPNLTVLDACCAPGSKTTDILLTEPQLKKLVAVDKDNLRLQQVHENVKRLQITTDSLEIINTDVCELKKQQFDRILIDAPCSATGVIRRHPDIKLLRKETDIEKQIHQQRKLLTMLWSRLKPNGLLLYSTCSILKAENQENVRWFLANNPDATLNHQQQLFPQKNGHDGFFYALLRKASRAP